jgi:predicted RNA-binding protein YlqC (UPF0109 family)
MIGNPDPKNSMSKISKIASSIKQLGEIQVTELDFMELLNKDIRELEIARSLTRLGSIRVMEWDFRTVMPAVNKLAHQEVDLVDLIRRTAHYKVMEWDFRSALSSEDQAEFREPVARLEPEEMQELIVRLKNFLQYVVVNLIDEPGHAQIKVREIAPNVLRFRLVLTKRDVAMLIGREGHTAAAIRSILKAAAGTSGVHVLLQIHSHEEDMAMTDGGSGE